MSPSFNLFCSFTVTSNVTVTSLFSLTSTSIPFFKFSSVNSAFSTPLTLMLPSTNVVFSGASSFTITFPDTSLEFTSVIVYRIFSPAFTVDCSAFLLNVITGVLTSSVGISFTVALFVSIPVVPSFTITSKLTVAVPAPFVLAFGTSTLIPSFKSFSVNSAFSTPLTLMLPLTNSVPVGTSSFTVAVPSAFPVFVTFIVYVNFSPATTAVLSAIFSLLITGLLNSVSVSSDGFSFT